MGPARLMLDTVAARACTPLAPTRSPSIKPDGLLGCPVPGLPYLLYALHVAMWVLPSSLLNLVLPHLLIVATPVSPRPCLPPGRLPQPGGAGDGGAGPQPAAGKQRRAAAGGGHRARSGRNVRHGLDAGAGQVGAGGHGQPLPCLPGFRAAARMPVPLPPAARMRTPTLVRRPVCRAGASTASTPGSWAW